MGINAELINLLIDLRRAGAFAGHRRVVELGAQDVSAAPEVVSTLLERAGLAGQPALLARDLYERFGYQDYVAIDTTGYLGARPLDLNHDLAAQGVSETFDLVTNLGTIEHVFDQAAAFRNVHNLCRVGGLMLHALPSQGNVNHGMYNYHPRFVWELAYANGYRIRGFYFTIDYRPQLFDYTAELFQKYDTRDTLLYVVLEKQRATAFSAPTDRIFTENAAVQASEFCSWIKTSWENALGHEALNLPASSDETTGEG